MGLVKMLFTVSGEPIQTLNINEFGKGKKVSDDAFFFEKIKLSLKYKTLVFCLKVSTVSALL